MSIDCNALLASSLNHVLQYNFVIFTPSIQNIKQMVIYFNSQLNGAYLFHEDQFYNTLNCISKFRNNSKIQNIRNFIFSKFYFKIYKNWCFLLSFKQKKVDSIQIINFIVIRVLVNSRV